MSWYTDADTELRRKARSAYKPVVDASNPMALGAPGPPAKPVLREQENSRSGETPSRVIRTRVRVELWIVLLLVVGTALRTLWVFYRHPPQPRAQGIEKNLLTPSELYYRDGRHGMGIYLAIMGEVFDVSAGQRHYGPRGSYRFFAGRDATRAFATGNFVDDLVDDVGDFSDAKLVSVLKWRDFFRRSEKYKPIGIVTGAFFDDDGHPTPLLLRAEALQSGGKKAQPALNTVHVTDLQPCNLEWTPESGTEVWCVEGVPRKVMEPGPDGQTLEPSCVCQKKMDVTRSRRLFGDCSPEGQRCRSPELDIAYHEEL